MTLPTTTQLNSPDDDSDMFGPPRSSPPIGYHHQRSRVPMISPKLRQREERKRILQLCAHKLERIKDSEANLRRSVCINNTYSRLTDEVRREKQSRYLANLPKSEIKPETARDNMFSPYHSPPPQHSINYSNPMELRNDHYQNLHQHHTTNGGPLTTGKPTTHPNGCNNNNNNNIGNNNNINTISTISSTSSSCRLSSSNDKIRSSSTTTISSSSCHSVDTDLEILDRELSAINASMPLIDPEITHGAEQLEKAISSRKRSRTEEENDRLVREALSQFYLPTQRLISAIDDCPTLDIKRSKLNHQNIINNNNNNNILINNNNHLHHHHLHHHHNCLTNGNDLDLDLSLDLNQSQKEFEVIMDALRLGTSSPTPCANDSCGQAAMMSESGVFHNLVVTSLET